MKAAPRGLVYVPDNITKDVDWSAQECVIPYEADDVQSGRDIHEATRKVEGSQ